MRFLSEVKLGLILYGAVLCFMSFGRFTHTSLYAYVRDITQRLTHLYPFINIDSSTLIFIIVACLILLISLHAIVSDDPYVSRMLFYLALFLFIPTAMPFSHLGIVTYVFPFSLTAEVSFYEIVGLGILIGCGLILCAMYSDHVALSNDLRSRGIYGWEHTISLNLLFGIAIVLLSGFLAFLLSLVYIYVINFTTFLAELSLPQILALLIITLALGAVSLWYMSKSGSLGYAHSLLSESKKKVLQD